MTMISTVVTVPDFGKERKCGDRRRHAAFYVSSIVSHRSYVSVVRLAEKHSGCGENRGL